MGWVQAVAAVSGLAARDIAEAGLLNNFIFFAGGSGGGSNDYKDFWRGIQPYASASALTQIVAHSSGTPFSEYARIGAIDDALYAVTSKVHKSTDGGANWTEIASSTPLGSDYYKFKTVPGDGYLRFVGPDVIYRYANEAFITEDDDPMYGSLTDFGAAEFDGGHLLIVGGATAGACVPPETSANGYATKRRYLHYFLRSPIGTWEKKRMPFAPRMWPAIATANGTPYIFGGFNNQIGADLNDTLKFTGDDIKQVAVATSPTARHGMSLIAQNNMLIGIAGKGTSHFNDVWKLVL